MVSARIGGREKKKKRRRARITAVMVMACAAFLLADPGNAVLPAVTAYADEEKTPDFYIKVVSGDGKGAILREKPSADSAQVLRDPIPDGTILHITSKTEDSGGNIWGYTNYSDVADGYILLQGSQEAQRKDLLQPSEEELQREAEKKAQEEKIALITRYFQTVDADGNVIEDDIPFVEDSSSEADSGGGSELPAESVSGTSSGDIASGSQPDGRVRSDSSESLSVRGVSSTSASSGLGARKKNGIPLLLPVIAALAAAAAGGVFFVLKRRKKKAAVPGSEDTAPETAEERKPSAGKEPGKRKGIRKPKSKPISEEKARKARKKS